MRIYTGPIEDYEYYSEVMDSLEGWTIDGDVLVSYWSTQSDPMTHTITWFDPFRELHIMRIGSRMPDGTLETEVIWHMDTDELIRFMVNRISQR